MTTPQPLGAAPRLYAGYTEEEANIALREWMQTPLTDEQKAILEAEEGAIFPEEFSAEGIEARQIVFDNSTAMQRQYTRDLNAMALVRERMNYNQTMVFTERLMRVVSAQDENETEEENIFAAIDADAATQVGPALHALGLGKEGT